MLSSFALKPQMRSNSVADIRYRNQSKTRGHAVQASQSTEGLRASPYERTASYQMRLGTAEQRSLENPFSTYGIREATLQHLADGKPFYRGASQEMLNQENAWSTVEDSVQRQQTLRVYDNSLSNSDIIRIQL